MLPKLSEKIESIMFSKNVKNRKNRNTFSLETIELLHEKSFRHFEASIVNIGSHKCFQFLVKY